MFEKKTQLECLYKI